MLRRKYVFSICWKTTVELFWSISVGSLMTHDIVIYVFYVFPTIGIAFSVHIDGTIFGSIHLAVLAICCRLFPFLATSTLNASSFIDLLFPFYFRIETIEIFLRWLCSLACLRPQLFFS